MLAQLSRGMQYLRIRHAHRLAAFLRTIDHGELLHHPNLRGVADKNEELEGYSLEQYFGNVPHPSGEWKLGQFSHDERTVDYYEFVRFQLAAPGYKFNPTRELRNAMDAICGDLKSRKVAVDQAVREGIHNQPHPEKLPPNIYGTYGTWEAFSTPSRDARLKTALIELKNMIARLVEKHEQSPELVDYDGDNLPGDLLHAFEEEAQNCKITYKRSNQTIVKLNMTHIFDRAFDLSFDPYHCPERRWGATGVELSTCTDNESKTSGTMHSAICVISRLEPMMSLWALQRSNYNPLQ